MEPDIRAAIEERLAYRRLKGDSLTRGGWYDPEKKKEVAPFGTYCTGPIKHSKEWGREDLIHFSCFNGQSPKHNSNPHGELEGGALSLKWLKYMVGDLSPCPGVVAKIDNLDDLERMNAEGGFIISDYTGLNAGELCFFLITQRFCQEQHERGQQWADFVDAGVDPRIAFILSHSFAWREDAEKGWTLRSIGAFSHSGFHDCAQWWAKNYYEGKWRGPVDLVGTPGNQAGYGKHAGLGRPGVSIGLDHPKRAVDGGWNNPPGYGYFGAKNGMDYKELEARVIEDVTRKDGNKDE